MAFTAFRGMKPFAQFMFTLFVMAVSMVILLVFSFILAIPFVGLKSLMAVLTPSGLNTPEGIILYKYLMVVQFLGFFIIPSLILGWLYHGNFIEYLHLNRTTWSSTFLYTALAVLMLIPLINFVGEINSHMQFPGFLSGVEDWMRTKEDEAKIITERLLKVEGIAGLMFNVFMIAMMPALGEELLFRGVIQRIFTNMTKNYHWGIWIAAFLFSTIHFQFYGFIPRFLLGAMFGYLLVWTGTIWAPILAHFVNNTMAVVGYYLIDKQVISKDIEQWGTGTEQFPLLLFSLTSVGLLLFLIYRNSNKTKMPVNQNESQAPRID